LDEKGIRPVTPYEAYDKFRANVYQDTWTHLPFFREVASGNVLEIGVNEGASTSAFLSGLQDKNLGGHLYSIDINQDCEKVFEGHPDWTFIGADSKDWPRTLSRIPSSIDVLFIDGDHTYRGASEDLKLYSYLVRRKGLILVHDMTLAEFPGVRQAVWEFRIQFGCGLHIREGSCGLGVMQVP
jgi:hypothetical protein